MGIGPFPSANGLGTQSPGGMEGGQGQATGAFSFGIFNELTRPMMMALFTFGVVGIKFVLSILLPACRLFLSFSYPLLPP